MVERNGVECRDDDVLPRAKGSVAVHPDQEKQATGLVHRETQASPFHRFV